MKNKKNNKKSKKKIDFKYNLSEYWSLMKNHKGFLIGLLIVVLFSELLAVADKFLFKRIVDDGTDFAAGTLSIEIFTRVLVAIALIYISLAITKSALKWLAIHLTNVLDSRVMLEIKEKYFNHIVGLSHNFHTTHKTGSLISRLGRGSHAIEGMTDLMVYNFAPMFLQLAIVGFSLAVFSIEPAIVILVMSISFILYSWFLQHIQQSYKLEYNRSEDFEKGLVSDVFTNIESVKYFGKDQAIKKRFWGAIERTRQKARKYWNYYRWFDAGQIFILGAGTFFLIYFPIKQFLAGQMTLGTLVFIYTVYGNVIGPMFGFVWGMRHFYRVMADFQDLFEYGKHENEIKDKPGAKNLEIKDGEIEFKNVDFSYNKDRKIFKNFNLKIPKNKKVALVGHSGCGKSTLVKLLYRLYDLQGGEILVDGNEIKDFKQESLRGEMAIVPQEAILFDDTIYNNIKFANPQATREDVLKAIRFAQLDKIIRNFPKKENTIVGERGVKLSGGEKQRVSIARAILADKKILVLDEATSALDSETEHEIQKDLKKLMEGRTSIIIAHRLSTIMNADIIVVMREGKIVQQGTHRELITEGGEYQRLWDFQKGGYVE